MDILSFKHSQAVLCLHFGMSSRREDARLIIERGGAKPAKDCFEIKQLENPMDSQAHPASRAIAIEAAADKMIQAAYNPAKANRDEISQAVAQLSDTIGEAHGLVSDLCEAVLRPVLQNKRADIQAALALVKGKQNVREQKAELLRITLKLYLGGDASTTAEEMMTLIKDLHAEIGGNLDKASKAPDRSERKTSRKPDKKITPRTQSPPSPFTKKGQARHRREE